MDDVKHVHFVTGTTTLSDGHTHNFQFALLLITIITDTLKGFKISFHASEVLALAKSPVYLGF